MKQMVLIAALFGAFMVSGCGDSAASQAKKIASLCEEAMNVGAKICDCIGDTAKNDLEKDERSLLIAMLSKDQDAAKMLREELPIASVTKAAMFMATAPATCAAAGR